MNGAEAMDEILKCEGFEHVFWFRWTPSLGAVANAGTCCGKLLV